MERSRKTKIIIIVALIISIASLSIGFAAFSTSLKLSSSAMVTPDDATFSVKFSTSKDELVVEDVVPSDISAGVTATAGVIDNSASPTLTNLSVTFSYPGQYAEYTFYARNEGEYAAYLNSIYFGNKRCIAADDTDTTIVEDVCSSINMSIYVNGIEYDDTTPISGHLLAKGAGENIKVRISYDENGQAITDPFIIKFGNVSLIYSTIDDSTYVPNTLGKTLLMDIISKNAILDTFVEFDKSPSTGTYVLNGTSNSTNPIYYYRGAVTNNNVKFANFCWKMVRTTETGGVKLIYNGVPTINGYCNNTGTASQIGESVFSHNFSLKELGYMYGNVVTSSSNNKYLGDQSEVYLYSSDVSWDGTTYTLVGDLKESSSWSKDANLLSEKYHYTCFNDTGICNEVYYINYYGNPERSYGLSFNGFNNIEEVKEKAFSNEIDSKIKIMIDSWYKSNMTQYTDYLEDTVWCNDRTNSAGLSGFLATQRNMSTFKPSVTCSNIRDSFTVDEANGNGKLTYPVGLLTADEYTLAGSGSKGYSTSAYLYTGVSQYSMTPYAFSPAHATMFIFDSSGSLKTSWTNYSQGVRPAISLKSGVYVSSDGDGSARDPYVVE